MNILMLLIVFMPIAFAFLSYIIGKKHKTGRNIFFGITVSLEFILCLCLLISVWNGATASVSLPEICGMGLNFTVNGFSAVYVTIASLMWMATGLFSPEYFSHYRNRNRYYFFQLLTLGATTAIFFSKDLYTTFVFFEIMSLASYVWVVQDEKKEAMRAGSTYLAVAVIGGLVMLMGLLLLYNQAGTLVIEELNAACEGKNVFIAAVCMLIGFGAKAGAFPLHIWLPKAHPVAPAPASALLSGILTKTGIFGILVISCKMLMHSEHWGALMLIIGVITMFLGALLALFSVNFKRTLACSSVSQIGFILVGVGMMGLLGEENILAVRGTFLHMVNHSMFKLILFLVAAVIFMNTHKLELNDIRGFGRKKPLLMAVYLMGALGIGGIPGWSGYISKTLLHESIVEYIEELAHGAIISTYFTAGTMKLIEWIFLISGGITLAYMCKLFIAVFIEKNADPNVQKAFDEKKPYMNRLNRAVLIAIALIIPVLGMLPALTMDNLANLAQGFLGVAHEGHAVHYFTWVNLKGGVISVCIGAALYLGVVRTWMFSQKTNTYLNRWHPAVDLEDRVYRPLLIKILPAISGFICGIMDRLFDTVSGVIKKLGAFLAGILDVLFDKTAAFIKKLGSFFAGILDVCVDAVVVALRRTVYRDSPDPREPDEGNALTHYIGVFLNKLEQLLNKTLWKNHPHKKDLEHWFVLKYAAFKENSTVIGRSLSFGLVLFCIGLCVTLIYLLVSTLM